MAPTHVHIVLKQLPEYFDPTLTLEKIDSACNKNEESENEDSDDSSSTSSEDKPLKKKKADFTNYRIIQKALTSPGLLELLRDICRDASMTRKRTGLFDQYDNWQYLSKKMVVDELLTFIYALACLSAFDPTEVLHRQLSVAATRTYITLLATPGQKQTNAYNEKVLLKCLQVFKLADTLSSSTHSQNIRSDALDKLLLEYINIMGDINLLLRFMTLKNCEATKFALIEAMKTVLMFTIKNVKNPPIANSLAEQVFETLTSICLPEHDDHNESQATVNIILNKTAIFYKLEFKNANENFQIYKFFIKILKEYPKETPPILVLFIKSVITNPPAVFSKPADYSYLLDVAVKYETAMFRYCNISILSYFTEIECSADTNVRVTLVEMLGRLAVIDCAVEWEVFQSEISDVPREITMFRILYYKLLDKNQSVRMKAFQVLLRLFQNGNKIVKQILKDTFHHAADDEDERNYLETNDVEELYKAAETELGLKRSDLNFEANVSPAKKRKTDNEHSAKETNNIISEIKGIEEIEEKLLGLIDIVYDSFDSPSSKIRGVGLSVLEHIVEMNRNIIDGEIFEESIMKLANDPVFTMRKTTLSVLNGILTKYPSYRPLIKLWSNCLLIFLDDQDPKLHECAMESLKLHVFDNIVRFEDSSSNKSFMPWMIIRAILISGKVNVLKSAVDSWIKKSVLTPQNLCLIESHIFTVNCSEAWIMLSIIAGKMKSKNPDVVIKTLGEIIQFDLYDSPVCFQYILDVIRPWLGDFTLSGLDHLFKILCDLLRTGSTTISLIHDVYSLCCQIKEKSDKKVDAKWVMGIRDQTADYLLHYSSDYSSFHMTNDRFLNSLIIYSETCTDLKDRPNERILIFMLEYLSHISEHENLITNGQNRKLNVTIIVITRFALRDGSLAAVIIEDFNKILKFRNVHESILTNIVVAFTDLCKRHTSLVDTSMKTVISQLNSHYGSVRKTALNNLNELIVQDYIKMRGRVLLNILTLLTDEDPNVSGLALYVIHYYATNKNEKLLKTSILECVYVFNDYLQHADTEMFPASEFDTEPSVLNGNEAEKVSKRYAVYDFFIKSIDDISLLMLLGNVNKLHSQLQNQKFVKCPEGAATLKDLIYIFTKICATTECDKKELGRAPEASEAGEDEMCEPSTSKTPVKGGARGKKGQQTMEHAMVVVEKMIAIYYEFQGEILKYLEFDESLDQDFKEMVKHFSLSIARTFKSSVEYAKPRSFWQEYLKEVGTAEKTPKKSSKKKKKNKDSDAEDGSDDENDEII